MSIEIEILNGDESWPMAKPLFEAVWPSDVVQKLPWGHVRWAHADLRVMIETPFARAGACAEGPWHQKRRLRRHALLEPQCASRMLLRHSARRSGDAHAQFAPLRGRDRLDRRARERPRADRGRHFAVPLPPSRGALSLRKSHRVPVRRRPDPGRLRELRNADRPASGETAHAGAP